jgi:hypothetical protein
MGPKRKQRDDSSSPEPGSSKRPKQAAPHARGGTHKVKDEHLTHTKWDALNRQQLEAELRTRPGLYKKDLKKHEIARRLADDDQRMAQEQRQRERDQRKRAEEEKKRRELEEQRKEQERKEQEEADAERRRLREQRRQEGEEVSDTTRSESESEVEAKGTEAIGTIVYSSPSSEPSDSESTLSSAPSPLFPNSRLRIFYWMNEGLAFPKQPPKEEPAIDKITCTVLDLLTTKTNETLQLPGRTYREEVGADYVHRLSEWAINCARNGVLVETLRKAVVEPAKDWAKRTHVESWTGHVYFKQLPRTSTTPLAEATRQLAKNAKEKKKASGKLTVKEKMLQRKKYKQQKVLTEYASSQWRPPIGFAPVHLSYPHLHDEEIDGAKALNNLFYIRFPGNDMPTYYFWTRTDDWQDPTQPNPLWAKEKNADEKLEREAERERQLALKKAANKLYKRPPEPEDAVRPYPLDETRTRVKKPGTPRMFRRGQKRVPGIPKYDLTVWDIERQLWADGLAAVLARYRDEWLQEGKEEQWLYLTKHMPKLYPSGKLPGVPPVLRELDEEQELPRSLAEKFACVEVGGPERPVSPVRGDEPWTGNDDEYWDVVDRPGRRGSSADEVLSEVSNEVREALEATAQAVPGRRASDVRSAAVPSPTTPRKRVRRLSEPVPRRSPWDLSSSSEEEDIQDEDVQGEDVQGEDVQEEDIQGELRQEEDIQDELRRSAEEFPPLRRRSKTGARRLAEMDNWLQGLDSSYLTPAISRGSVSSVGETAEEIRAAERRQWENLFDAAVARDAAARKKRSKSTRSKHAVVPGLATTVDSIPVARLKWELNALPYNELKREKACRVCLEPLRKGDVAALREHYKTHHDEASELCPFCGMDWTVLDSRVSLPIPASFFA